MNYTREPIIETVISPKEGCKLVVRNSKGGGQEEYFVEALEVVNFGNAIFFRSTERPKSFLVPATDYEVIELKETKMILKSTSIEQSIKIGGGKTIDKSQRRKKLNKKHHKPEVSKPPSETQKGGGQDDETQVSSSILRKLFPPPANLIKEKLNHIKSTEKIDESISKEIVKEENKTQEIKSDQKVQDEKATKEESEIEKPKVDKPIQEEKKEE